MLKGEHPNANFLFFYEQKHALLSPLFSPSSTAGDSHGQLHHPHLTAAQLSDYHTATSGITGVRGITHRAGVTVIPNPS